MCIYFIFHLFFFAQIHKRDVYLKLTCNLSSAHAVSETATPLGQKRKQNGKCEQDCHEIIYVYFGVSRTRRTWKRVP